MYLQGREVLEGASQTYLPKSRKSFGGEHPWDSHSQVHILGDVAVNGMILSDLPGQHCPNNSIM